MDKYGVSLLLPPAKVRSSLNVELKKHMHHAQDGDTISLEHDFPMIDTNGIPIPTESLWHGHQPSTYDNAQYIGVDWGNAQDIGATLPQQWPSNSFQQHTPSDLLGPETELWSATSALYSYTQGHVAQSVQDEHATVYGSDGDTFSQVSSFPEPFASDTSGADSWSYSTDYSNSRAPYNSVVTGGRIPFGTMTVSHDDIDAYSSLPSPGRNDDDDAVKYYIVDEDVMENADGEKRPFHCAFVYTNRNGDLEECDKAYAYKYRVLRHYKTAHGDRSERPWCNHCQQHFSDEHNYRAHLKRHKDPRGLLHLRRQHRNPKEPDVMNN